MVLSTRKKGDLGKEANKLAKEARKTLGLDPYNPIEDIFSVLENQGALIVRFPSEDDRLSGYTVRLADFGCIYINSGHSLGRQHFSAAHELCHLLYDILENPIPPSYDGDFEEEDINNDPVEYRANSFASHFLMPDDTVKDYWKVLLGRRSPRNIHISDVIKLQHFFKVSFYAALIKLNSLKLIWYKMHFQPMSTFSSKEKALVLQQLTERAELKTDLILPTNQNYITPSFVKYAILNYQEDRITDGKMEFLLNLMGLPENEILEIEGVEDD